jgi:mono/diheme cytochrome c family protein
MGRFLIAGLMAATSVLAAAVAQAAEPAPSKNPAAEKAVADKGPAAAVDYFTKIKPIFARRCVACHGHLKQESGLRVDAARFLLKGGERGPAIVGGDLEKSVLLAAVSGKADFQMPPEGEPLAEAEVALIRQWITEGAKGPTDEKVLEDPRKHWSFVKPVRPAVPPSKNAAWVRNPIDAFIAAGHDAHGLKPQGPAPRNILLRRVFLDLTGLPPKPEELRAFLADDSPEAYAKVVDRLLDSPQYGERWARHWMDVWRYSDWYGYQQELRNSAKHIWRWRDWIVESLNENKPYDRMVLEMLAADEIAPEDPRALRATGYLARSYYKFNRNVWLDTAIEHTSKAFLGVTMNCARCHDHKYDPVTQQEYYQFRAIFEPYNVRTDAVPGQANVELDGVARVFDAKLDEKTFLFVRGDDKSPDKDHALEAALPALFTKGPLDAKPISLPSPHAIRV